MRPAEVHGLPAWSLALANFGKLTMNVPRKTAHVDTAAELVRALNDNTVTTIIVARSMTDLAPFALEQGKVLKGANPQISIAFLPGTDGILVGKDVSISSLEIGVERNFRAIHNRTDISDLGVLSLYRVTTVGQIQILGKEKLLKADIRLNDVTVVDSDSYDRPERPASGTGPGAGNVDIIQGAITVFNMQPDPASVFRVWMRGISIGSPAQPVSGSGVLLSGASGNIYTRPGVREGGQVVIGELETIDVYIHSRIPPDTVDLIAGAVFVAYAKADRVRNLRNTTSNGTNGLGLDNWGSVRSWVCLGKVQTFGDSGIAVVHSGILDALSIASIETFGSGGRAFNALRGRIGSILFGEVRTNGDGASGVYVRADVDSISVSRDIVTYGSVAPALESGVIAVQSAIALWIDNGHVQKILVGGSVRTHGDGSQAISINQSIVNGLSVGSEVRSSGIKTDAINVSDSAVPLVSLHVRSDDGAAAFFERATIQALKRFKAEGVTADVFVSANSVVHTKATTVQALENESGNAFRVSGPGNLIFAP
jgi:hypothetical protein